MYVILGASGNTGKVTAEALLKAGAKVRAVGRNPERLESLRSKGAEVFIGDTNDASALARAFAGAKAVYAMIPPDIANADVLAHYRRCVDAITAAVKAAGVKHVVTLSSVGAELPEKTGPILGLHYLEQQLNALPGLNVLHLRAGYFMENTLAQVGAIQKMGVTAGPLRPDLKVAMIATSDIGEVAAKALLALDFQGIQARELQGQRDLSMNEVTTIIGKAIGKPDLRYVPVTPEQAKPAMMQMGMSASMADGLLELSASLNSGYLRFLQARSPQNTTPTSYEEFANKVFRPAYLGQQAA